MDLGDKIRTLRLDMDMTQEELAEAVNTSKQNIYKYEKGIITNIPSDKIEKLANALDTTPAYLMGWVDYDDSKEHASIRDYFIEYLNHIGFKIYPGVKKDELELVKKHIHYIIPLNDFNDLHEQARLYIDFVFTQALTNYPVSPESDRTVYESKETNE